MTAYDRNLEALGGCNGQDSEPILCADGCGRPVEETGHICEVCRKYDGKLMSALGAAVERAETNAKRTA
jgi:hypothetical protein